MIFGRQSAAPPELTRIVDFIEERIPTLHPRVDSYPFDAEVPQFPRQATVVSLDYVGLMPDGGNNYEVLEWKQEGEWHGLLVVIDGETRQPVRFAALENEATDEWESIMWLLGSIRGLASLAMRSVTEADAGFDAPEIMYGSYFAWAQDIRAKAQSAMDELRATRHG